MEINIFPLILFRCHFRELQITQTKEVLIEKIQTERITIVNLSDILHTPKVNNTIGNEDVSNVAEALQPYFTQKDNLRRMYR